MFLAIVKWNAEGNNNNNKNNSNHNNNSSGGSGIARARENLCGRSNDAMRADEWQYGGKEIT